MLQGIVAIPAAAYTVLPLPPPLPPLLPLPSPQSGR
jgi:hypothetical protein